jgi:hypothetical protein
MRPLTELTADDTGWSVVRQWVDSAKNPAELLGQSRHGPDALVSLQVTTRSPMGALAYHAGGLVVDHGWLRFLGGGHPRLNRRLDTWTETLAWGEPTPKLLVVADDVLGGLFALNGGALPGPAGEVFYLAPDTLEWESCEMGYSDLVQWALVGDLAQFYEGFRWSGWQDDLKAWGPDRSLSIYPFLWSEGPAIDQRTRAPVDAKQAVNLELEFIRQLQTA